eukprot:CAMPEP_0201505228 /NCGR_PEP_ID=MMETSP0151_2-20130828/85650_1 /ASSEMBLY_ACC=CAM_ASM_000257 /TAXON_ID=200890 /ORGANISM="Paramoeba atlantica, Strain 621/1 / CCAP 1560/9" /LENGTH=561 /DNA_ID=CAMNT_0047899063 /DNA_START=355 /DNA_END=2040 /DNA_ORIENTATION=+
MYFCLRAPLPLNVNPFIQLTSTEEKDINARLSTLIWSSLRYREALNNQSLEPDVFHLGTVTDKSWFKMLASFAPRSFAYALPYLFNGYPLDMSQHQRMFGGARIPHKYRDEYRQNKHSRHIVVMHNDNVYLVNVLNQDGTIATPEAIREALDTISNDKCGTGVPIGIFTSEERNHWADIRAYLESNPKNRENLDAIDSALFAVSLDNQEPQTHEERGHQFLHNHGRNRWFDKSFSLLGAKGGDVAVHFEHSWGDGVCVVRYAEEIFADQKNVPSARSGGSIDSPVKLEWDLDDKISQSLQKSEDTFRKVADSLQLKTIVYEKYGKNQLKKFRISPDAIAQLAIQLGHYRLHNKIVATYESASTAGFKGGRTETIRSATTEATKFVESMCDPSVDASQRADLLREAATIHNQISTEAKTGKGVDRHLFALANISKNLSLRSTLQEKGLSGDELEEAMKLGGGDHLPQGVDPSSLPSIFQDAAWQKINHVILSTSTLASAAIEGGGFGPVVPDGYGIGYGVRDQQMGFNVSTYRGDAPELAESIGVALDDIMTTLTSAPSADS